MRMLAKLGLLLFFACIALPAWAADKLPAPIEAAFADAKATMMDDPAVAFSHVAEGEALARKLSDPRQRMLALATARWLAAEAHLRSNDPVPAGPLLIDGLRLIAPIKEATKLRGDLLMSQGTFYMQSDQAAAALANYLDAAAVFKTVNEPRSRAIALQNIALLYSAANDNDNAEQYFAMAADAFTGDPMLSLSLYNNRGNVLLNVERYGEAEAEYRKALEIARSRDNKALQARILGNIGRSQVEAGKLDEADATLAEGFALIQGADVQGFRQQLLATSARVAMERGNWSRARQLVTEAFQGVDLTKTSSAFRDAHIVAYMIFSHTGDPALALKHLEAVRRLKDEATKVATTTTVALMAAKFKSADKDAKIANLNAERIRKAAEFQRTIFTGVGGAALIIVTLLTIALLVIRRSRNQVRDANVVLGTTNVALEKALKAKTEFLATTSHEIRTPLNGILGMTQVMLSDPRTDAQTRDRIGIVHSAGETMKSLVDDILDVAKIETGNLTVEAAPMDLCAVLKDVTRIWEEQALAKGLTFNLELSHAPRWIVSDAGRLRQIVFNLLSNAIKFTEQGSVGLRAVAEGEGDAKDGGRRLKLVFTDTGIGIPAEKCEEIFESFKQVDAGTTRKFGGTGLGLTICRNLALALGGDVTVESKDGEGSCFTLNLPLIFAEAPGEAAAATGKGTLLVLDRNPIARSMLKTLLEPRVGSLRFLATPDEVPAALVDGATQLLMDEVTLKAAGGDPFATLAALAEAAKAVNCATAVLWARPDDDTRARLAAAGVGQVIEKPVGGAALIEAVISQAEENSVNPGSTPLVSCAA
jgi:signal transduction histidine kinase/Tfp pilus assembly protein PilF/CheY-like chemotaxis protein